MLNKLDKVVELVGGGSVINGAYPIEVFYLTNIFNNMSHVTCDN